MSRRGPPCICFGSLDELALLIKGAAADCVTVDSEAGGVWGGRGCCEGACVDAGCRDAVGGLACRSGEASDEVLGLWGGVAGAAVCL